MNDSTKQSLDFDTIGDIQKKYEKREAARDIIPGIPVLARLDGRAFHSFVKGLRKPYEPILSHLMETTMKELVSEFSPKIGYTQSDEITLCWANQEDDETKLMFGGKFQKLCSIIAASATVIFNHKLRHFDSMLEYWQKRPVFDCRVWQVPTLKVASENLLWREMDATKNSVSMAASVHFSASNLLGVTTAERKKALRDIGHPWEEHPDFFKKGVYAKRVGVQRVLDAKTLEEIPEEYRPTEPVSRTIVETMYWPPATKIKNFEGVLFHDEEPELTVENT